MKRYILNSFIASFSTLFLVFIAILILNINYVQTSFATEVNKNISSTIKNNNESNKVKNSVIKNERIDKTQEIKFNLKDRITNNFDDKSISELSIKEAKIKIEKAKAKGQDTNLMEVDYYLKFSLPLATFFVALIAAPIGIKFAKRGSYFGVAISISIVFAWYLIYSIARSLGGSGVIQPVIAAWIQNIILGVIGILLLTFANRK